MIVLCPMDNKIICLKWLLFPLWGSEWWRGFVFLIAFLQQYFTPVRSLTDEEKVLAICDQSTHISFTDFFSPMWVFILLIWSFPFCEWKKIMTYRENKSFFSTCLLQPESTDREVPNYIKLFYKKILLLCLFGRFCTFCIHDILDKGELCKRKSKQCHYLLYMQSTMGLCEPFILHCAASRIARAVDVHVLDPFSLRSLLRLRDVKQPKHAPLLPIQPLCPLFQSTW